MIRALFLPQNFLLTLHVVEVALLVLVVLDLGWRYVRGRRPSARLCLDGGRRLKLRRQVVLGSSPGKGGVAVAGSQVSRRHLELCLVAEGIRASDVGSTNGTFLGELDLRETGPRILRPGDRLELGRGGPGLEVRPIPPSGLLPPSLQVLAWVALLWCGLWLGWRANVERLPEAPLVIGQVSLDYDVFRAATPMLGLGLLTTAAGLAWFAVRRRFAGALGEAGTALQVLLVLGLVMLYPLLPAISLRYARAAERGLEAVGRSTWATLEARERAGQSPPSGDDGTEIDPAVVRRYNLGRSAVRWAANLGARTGQAAWRVTVFRQSLVLVAALACGLVLPLASGRLRRLARQSLELLTRPLSRRLVQAADHGSELARVLRPIAYWDIVCGLVAAGVVAVTLWSPLGTTLGRGKSLYLDLPGLTVQSVEVVKALFVLFMAGFFARQGELLVRAPRQRYMVPYLLAVLGTLALTAVQADMGALFMLGIFLGLVFLAATGKVRLVALVPLLVGAGFGLAWALGLASIVATRLGIWLAPRTHRLGEQLVQARQVLLSSDWIGFTPTRLLAWKVPDIQSDLVVAAFGERFGAVGLLALIACWFVLVASFLRAAGRARPAASIFLASVAALVLVQVLTQSGGAMGLLPLTGVPIPWLSHGLTASLIFTVLVSLAVASTLEEDDEDATANGRGRPRTHHLRYLEWANLAISLVLAGLVLTWTVLLPRLEDVGAGGRHYRWRDTAREDRIDGWVGDGLFTAGPGGRVEVDVEAWRQRRGQPGSTADLGRLRTVAEGLRLRDGVIRPLPWLVSNPNVFAERSLQRGWLTGRDGTAFALTESGKRRYPLGRAAFHPVGYAGGLAQASGIEAGTSAFLRGIDLAPDVRRQAFLHDIHHGPDVLLTRDAGLQTAAFAALEDRPGAVVVMDLDDGALLALASSPSVEPEGAGVDDWQEWARLEERPLVHRALRSTELYSPPGSVFKIVVAAGILLHTEVVDPARTITCRGRDSELRVSCAHGHAHGRVDLDRALIVSCNIYFARAAVALGRERLRVVAERFGFNAEPEHSLLRGLPDAELPWAVSTVLGPATEVLTPAGLARVGYGQGPVSATPLQIAVMGGVVASGGDLIAPYLVDAVGLAGERDGVRRRLWERRVAVPYRRNVLPLRLTERLRGPLTEVFERGTARSLDDLWHGPEGYRLAARSPGDGWERIPVAGKTGSAWKTRRSEHDDAWMVAWAPADRPRVLAAVLVEGAGEGGKVAGPIAVEMVRAALERVEKGFVSSIRE